MGKEINVLNIKKSERTLGLKKAFSAASTSSGIKRKSNKVTGNVSGNHDPSINSSALELPAAHCAQASTPIPAPCVRRQRGGNALKEDLARVCTR